MSPEVDDAYRQLHPSLQYVIATNLGWRTLRPVQRDAIGPILAGANTVVVAPTAGGKTEAAMLPLFSRILDERWAPTSVLYLAPLRALLNDLGARIGDLAQHLGLSVAVWHGDVNQRERRRIVATAPDVLLTTPESLEVLLSFANDDRRALLGTIRAVVVDEAHAFYGIDRGTHLLALLERLQAWAKDDPQRIALSATIGNPDDLLDWIAGSSTRLKSLVRVTPDMDRVELFEVSYCPSLPSIVSELGRFRSEKIIAFCRTRSDVEELAHTLDSVGVPAWPHHSALAREHRQDAELAFRAAPHGVLVATSTLELGIDIGDLDRVVQIDAPTTVASLLQRLGRSGRRGDAARMNFLATNPEQLMLATALLSLRREGWVEPLSPDWRPFPILAQQALATILQTNGIARSGLVERLAKNRAFAKIEEAEIATLVDHLIENDIVTVTDGTVGFGLTGERRFGYRRFMELASVFRTSENVAVVAGNTEIGTLDRWFIEQMRARNRSTFLLAGRAWKVTSWPVDDAILEVVSATSAEAPLFLGGGIILGFTVMQRMRRILADSASLAEMGPIGIVVAPSCDSVITEFRRNAESQKLTLPGSPLIRANGEWQWYTYAGLRANRLLADVLFASSDQAATVTNTSIRGRGAEINVATFLARIRELANNEIMHESAEQCMAGSVSAKFDDILPVSQLAAFSRERAYDREGAEFIIKAGVRVITISS